MITASVKKLYLFFLLLLPEVCSVAQNIQHRPQYLYWTRYQVQLQFSPRYYWSNEIDNRRFFNPDVQNQFIFHSRFHYRNKGLDVGAGLTGSYAYASFPEEGYRKPRKEFRPVLEASYETQLHRFFLQNRVRADSRFLADDAEVPLFDAFEYVMRLRYRLQVRTSILQDQKGTSMMSVRLSNETMLNTRGNAFDQNRIYLGTEYAISPSIALEAGYIYIYQQRFARDEFFHRHVLRVSILHRIKL